MPDHLTENLDLERFLSHCHRRRYPKKTRIISPGDPADTLYYIVEGSVVVNLEDEDGRELILSYLNTGEFLGELKSVERGVAAAVSATPRPLRLTMRMPKRRSASRS